MVAARYVLMLMLVAFVVAGCGSQHAPRPAAPAAGGATPAAGDALAQSIARCEALAVARQGPCDSQALFVAIRDARDPNSVLPRIMRAAAADHALLGVDCHVLMHDVGRRYAAAHDVTLSSLMSYLPRNNDSGCSAGFAHGLLMHIAPAVMQAGPQAAAAICSRPATRFERYSCVHGLGHAYMRAFSELLGPALRLCGALGPRDGPDCAQGAFHDYWLSIAGTDKAARPPDAQTDPRKLCAAQSSVYVRPCWYRAFIETRPFGYRTGSAADIERLCAGLSGLQRAGCVTGASVIGSPNPLAQMRVCVGLRAAADTRACLHGVKVENLVGSPAINMSRVLRRCGVFGGATRRDCFTWMGKTLNVVTDGRFARAACPRLPDVSDRRACRDGGRHMNDALVTFS